MSSDAKASDSHRVIEVRDDSAPGKAKDKASNNDASVKEVKEKTSTADTSKDGHKSRSSRPAEATTSSSKPHKTAEAQVAQTSAAKSSSGRSSAAAPALGLSDDVLTQVASSKFEAQEERLKDVVRNTVCLLRDFQKLNAAECDRKIGEIRKCLLKYEMQYVRVSELQEERRKSEIVGLQAEATRCREEAEAEGSTIVDLRQVLVREKRRRERYERYEEAAMEVSKKKSRADSQSEIDATTAAIAELKQRRCDLDAMIDQRNQRAQLLLHAAAEMTADLRREQQATAQALKNGSTASAPSLVEVIS